MHFFVTKGGLGLSMDVVPDEPRVRCPVCKAKLERVAGAGAICASCGYAENHPAG